MVTGQIDVFIIHTKFTFIAIGWQAFWKPCRFLSLPSQFLNYCVKAEVMSEPGERIAEVGGSNERFC